MSNLKGCDGLGAGIMKCAKTKNGHNEKKKQIKVNIGSVQSGSWPRVNSATH